MFIRVYGEQRSQQDGLIGIGVTSGVTSWPTRSAVGIRGRSARVDKDKSRGALRATALRLPHHLHLRLVLVEGLARIAVGRLGLGHPLPIKPATLVGLVSSLAFRAVDQLYLRRRLDADLVNVCYR